MQALRTRLLVTLAAVLLAAWSSGFAIAYLDVLERQSREVDGMLRNVAEQLLQALPADIATAGRQQRFELRGEPEEPKGKFGLLGFQVWEHGTGRRLLSSRPAPAHAMSASFTEGFSDDRVDGVPWRVYGLSDAGRRVQVQVGLPQSAMRAELLLWLGPSLATALLLLLCIGVATWLVIHWSLRQVVRMSDALAARHSLDLTPLPEHGLPTEVAPLVTSFNRVLARLDAALQQERAFIGEAAHELRTPLAALLAQAQVLQHATGPEEAREALDQLIAGIERTSRLAQQLLDSARVEAGSNPARTTNVDLAMVAEMVANEFELVAQRSGQSVDCDVQEALVHGDIDDLGILVRNLIDNALRHGGPGTRVRLQTRTEAQGSEGTAILTVADDGPGIPPAERERVFERFYRADSGHPTQGIGMGLSLVARVVASHGGCLRSGSGLGGRGFGVEIRLPGAGNASAQADARGQGVHH
ncbi:sensor histidine kinase [Xanthomonas maliensis]|uniref:sensor histidine kinase n=1 Tax=Xanthomonas maliensis TaxID=1321368 RepID=UPI0003A7D5EF|nr:ATP-binding protein [Xanthomonas maliensis]KAB7764315.1 two-component sensor histidine kinase [Xanthomonas maliensis]